MARRPTPLTDREERFVGEYLIQPNATRAYLRAFRTRAGRPTYHTARTEAAKLLANPCISAAVAAGRKELRRQFRLSATRVIRELSAVAFADPIDGFEWDEEARQEWVRPLRDMPADHRRVIRSMKITRRRTGAGAVVETVEVKYADKLTALDKLARHLGLLKDGAALDELLAMFRDGRAGAAGLPALPPDDPPALPAGPDTGVGP